MTSTQQDRFAVGSPWPLWAPFETFALKSYTYALSTGFNPFVVDESKSKPKYDLNCGAPGCEFVVKVRATKRGEAQTSELNLRHNHEPLNFDEPDDLDSEGKQVHDDVTECLQQAKKRLKAKAKDEIIHLRNSADYCSTSTSNREANGYLSFASEQETVVWDLCDLLNETSARSFERGMREARQLADDYPIESTLDGAAHPLAAPPEARFPGSAPAPAQQGPIKDAKKPRGKSEKSKRARKEVPSKSRSKKPRLEANATQDIVVTPEATSSPLKSPDVNGFAAYANASSPSEVLNMLAASVYQQGSTTDAVREDADGALPFAPGTPIKRAQANSEDRGDTAVGLVTSTLGPLSSSTSTQPHGAMWSEADLTLQGVESTWLTLAADVLAGADDMTSLLRESAPSPTLPGKSETPAPDGTGDEALGEQPQAEQDELGAVNAAASTEAEAASPLATPAQQEPKEQVEQDPFAGYFTEVGELFDFAYRYYDKLLKSGENAPSLPQTAELDGNGAFAETLSLATASAHELPLRMFECSLALRHGWEADCEADEGERAE